MKYFIEIPGLVKDNGGKCWLIKVLLKNPQFIPNNSNGIIPCPGTCDLCSGDSLIKGFPDKLLLAPAGMWTFMTRHYKVVD